MSTVFIPDEEKMRLAGYAAISHVPVLFGKNPQNGRNGWYCQEMNRYLRERAVAEWSPSGEAAHAAIHGRKVRYPTRRSLRSFADCLANFNDWLDWSGRDWRTVRYTEDIVQGYQADMLAGRWSQDNRPLAESTVSVRVGEACHFLAWAAERGLRGEFRILHGSVSIRADRAGHAHGHQPLRVKARAGGVRRHPKDLRLPTEEEMTRWKEEVNQRRGATKLLMCNTTLHSGNRLEETAQWRVDTLPLDPKDWRIIGDQVRVELKYGTKGPKHAGPNGEELGPARVISIPLWLARQIHEYREGPRLKATAKWIKAHKGQPKPMHLFLSEYDGSPIQRASFYHAWTDVKHPPFKGWSPQLGRHWWACTTLLKELKRQAEQAKSTLDKMPHGWIDTSGRSIIDTVIRPQLGHINSATTDMYLRWVQQAIMLADTYIAYHESLEEDNNG